MPQANNSALMRENNRRLILDLIRKRPRSRADIARATGLSRAAVTILIDVLTEEGLIMTGKSVRSESGRRPTLLYLNPHAYVSVGVDLSREGCALLLTDFTETAIFEKKLAFQSTAEETVELLCNEILLALEQTKGQAKPLGICVCAPGPIDSGCGVILNPSGLTLFHHFDIKRAISSRIGLPIYLEKDTNALAIAEQRGKEGTDDLLFLLADHGIGCSIIKDGQLFLGRNGMGGELGHTTIDINGPVCSCGNVGCAELYASIPATVKRSGARDWTDLLERAKAGDTAACKALTEQGRILGTLCVGAVNLFEPHSIVLGGRLTDADFILHQEITDALNRAAFSRHVHGFRVRSSRLGKNARAYAAAVTAIERYFHGGSDR